MKRKYFYRIILCLILLPMLLLSSCRFAQDTDQADYISATGRIHYIQYNDNNTVLYLGLSDLVPSFDDFTFKIEGEYLQTARENNIDSLLKIGEEITFITDPEYLGDGYIYPIVGLTINGITVF